MYIDVRRQRTTGGDGKTPRPQRQRKQTPFVVPRHTQRRKKTMKANELETTARRYHQVQAEIKTLEEMADALKQKVIHELDVRGVEELSAGAYMK